MEFEALEHSLSVEQHQVYAKPRAVIEDPLRDTFVDSIRHCHKAGITFIMCTGDIIDTATAISKNTGIVTNKDVKDKSKKYFCMTGEDFIEDVRAELVKNLGRKK